jgi:hypothetical protein
MPWRLLAPKLFSGWAHREQPKESHVFHGGNPALLGRALQHRRRGRLGNGAHWPDLVVVTVHSDHEILRERPRIFGRCRISLGRAVRLGIGTGVGEGRFRPARVALSRVNVASTASSKRRIMVVIAV